MTMAPYPRHSTLGAPKSNRMWPNVVAIAYTRVRPRLRASIVAHKRVTMVDQIYQLARLLAMVRRVKRLCKLI